MLQITLQVLARWATQTATDYRWATVARGKPVGSDQLQNEDKSALIKDPFAMLVWKCQDKRLPVPFGPNAPAKLHRGRNQQPSGRPASQPAHGQPAHGQPVQPPPPIRGIPAQQAAVHGQLVHGQVVQGQTGMPGGGYGYGTVQAQYAPVAPGPVPQTPRGAQEEAELQAALRASMESHQHDSAQQAALPQQQDGDLSFEEQLRLALELSAAEAVCDDPMGQHTIPEVVSPELQEKSETLAQMGFDDRERNILELKAMGEDIERTLNKLLESGYTVEPPPAASPYDSNTGLLRKLPAEGLRESDEASLHHRGLPSLEADFDPHPPPAGPPPVVAQPALWASEAPQVAPPPPAVATPWPPPAVPAVQAEVAAPPPTVVPAVVFPDQGPPTVVPAAVIPHQGHLEADSFEADLLEFPTAGAEPHPPPPAPAPVDFAAPTPSNSVQGMPFPAGHPLNNDANPFPSARASNPFPPTNPFPSNNPFPSGGADAAATNPFPSETGLTEVDLLASEPAAATLSYPGGAAQPPPSQGVVVYPNIGGAFPTPPKDDPWAACDAQEESDSDEPPEPVFEKEEDFPPDALPSGPATHLEALEEFFRIHKPENVSKAEKLLSGYIGREEILYEKLEEKYGVSITRAVVAGGVGDGSSVVTPRSRAVSTVSDIGAASRSRAASMADANINMASK